MITFLQTYLCKFRINSWGIITGLVLTIFYFSGLMSTPFHPDESSYLYMSKDFQRYYINPTTMTWNAENQDSPAQRYRLIDAPLTRYIAGLGMLLFGIEPNQADWNWSATWIENESIGARPERATLFAGRFFIALLFPINLFLLYTTLTRVAGRLAGLIGIILFGTNALVLLHTRRIMAEPGMVTAILFALFSLSSSPTRPWLNGLAAALTFNAKFSAIAFFPVGLISVIIQSPGFNKGSHRFIRNALVYLVTFVLVTLALNPVFWDMPAKAINAAIEERNSLLDKQVIETGLQAPGQILRSYGERMEILLAHLYVTSPIVSEIGNYDRDQSEEINAYNNNPFHYMLRNYPGGGLLLGGTILGLGWGVYHTHGSKSRSKQFFSFTIAYTVLQALVLIIFIPLPWQRYSLHMVPIICFWTALGFNWIIQTSRELLSSGRLKADLTKIFA